MLFGNNCICNRKNCTRFAHAITLPIAHAITLDTQAGVVFGAFMAVFIYRLAISGWLYHLHAGDENRPTIVDIVVSTTGAALQVFAIEVLNKVYEYLARSLNDWGKCWVYTPKEQKS